MKRNALSLIEVVLSIAILVGSAAVLGQLISMGQRQAIKADDITIAQNLCFSKMSEILSGVSELAVIEDEPIELDSPWDYSVAIEPIGISDLLEVTVRVKWRTDSLDGTKNTKPTPNFYIRRWLRQDGREIDGLLSVDDANGIGAEGEVDSPMLNDKFRLSRPDRFE